MVCHAQSATSVRPHRLIPPRPPVTDLIIEHAIGLFLDSLVSQGVRDATVIVKGCMLRRFFAPMRAEPLRSLSTERLQQLIAALAESPNKRTGAALTAATLTTCRETARCFTCWCTLHNRIPADPMAALVSAAKKKTLAQLHDELNTLRAKAFATGPQSQAPAISTRRCPTAVLTTSADLTIAAALTRYLESLTAQGKRPGTICTQKAAAAPLLWSRVGRAATESFHRTTAGPRPLAGGHP